MFDLDVSINVTLYGQEQCTWCGAASAQMVRNGYPTPDDRLYYTQADLWNTIQTYNSTDATDVGQGWATDPHGLTGCLQNLSNPPGVHWVEYSNASADAVLHFMCFWMNKRRYPSPVLINQGGHWVVIVGYQTDVEPQSGNTITLQQISFDDPEPHNVGTYTVMAAAQWYAGPWNGPVMYAGTWLNKYVAVVEPPKTKGSVKVERVERTGTRLLPPTRAVEFAKRWIKEMNLGRNPRYGILNRDDVEALAPLLVRDNPRMDRQQSDKEKRVPHYYVVPFGIAGESQRGEAVSRVSVLVNAYTGNFEEITAFGKPIRYLSREQVLDVAATALRVPRKQLEKAKATLIFQPSRPSHIRAYPFWEIVVKDKTIYVDQLGEVFGTLLLNIPGD